MSLIRIDRNPSRRQLAVFGVAWLVAFAALGGMALSQNGLSAAAVIWTAAVLIPGIGWLVPSFMRIVYLGMAYLTFPFGLAVSFVILAAIYYTVLTPIGLLMRLVGYDPMCRRRDANAASYWTSREPVDDVRRYFRQF
jgi:hypothetical protein